MNGRTVESHIREFEKMKIVGKETVEEVVKKLADYCERQGLQRPELVVLDDEMINKHLELYPDDPNKPVICQPGGFQYLLLQPKEYLLKLWRDSAEEALSQIPSTQEIIFMFTHSVFYHTWSRDFIHCVDFNHFHTCLKDLSIDLVVTLIDDIYDCWRRLKERGQLFSPTDNVVQAILDLFLLLSIVFGFVSLAFLIALLVYVFLRTMK